MAVTVDSEVATNSRTLHTLNVRHKQKDDFEQYHLYKNEMVMKKIILTISVIIICKQLIAQQNDTSWYKKSMSDFSTIYFGISNEMGTFHDAESYFWGFDMGLYFHPFNNSMKSSAIKIGLGGAWLDNSVNIDFQTSNKYISYPINIKYGGLRVGILFFTDALFIPSFDILFASGDLRYQIPDNVFNLYKNELVNKDVPLYIIMPKLNFEIRLTKNLKFGWGFSYKFVSGINVPWSNNAAVSNFGYHGTFIGVFGK